MDEEQIRAVIERVCETFSNLDMSAWYACFHQPCIIIGPKGGQCLNNFEDCQRHMQPVFDRLRQQDFGRSRLDDCKIKLVGDYFAIVSAVWSRFTRDGKLIQQFGASYSFNKTDLQWKISLLTSHAKEWSML